MTTWKPALFHLTSGRGGGRGIPSRVWLPPSQSSAGDGAVSFGITMGSNAGFGIVKEFLPDLGRALAKKHKKPATGSTDTAPHSVSCSPTMGRETARTAAILPSVSVTVHHDK
jgi:hypothetical protein